MVTMTVLDIVEGITGGEKIGHAASRKHISNEIAFGAIQVQV
jgi:hypothetical protein